MISQTICPHCGNDYCNPPKKANESMYELFHFMKPDGFEFIYLKPVKIRFLDYRLNEISTVIGNCIAELEQPTFRGHGPKKLRIQVDTRQSGYRGQRDYYAARLSV
jgi:hypothetical protein